MRNLGKVGMIFNGGGFTGAFSVGFAKAIWNAGIRPEVIQGVSVGGLTAAEVVEGGVEEAEKKWLNTEKLGPKYIFNWMDIPGNVARRRSSLFNNDGVRKIVDSIDASKVVNSPIELQIVTRNETKDWEKEIAKNHDPKFIAHPELFLKRILASAAIPPGLPPIETENEIHSDGMSYTLKSMIQSNCDTIFLLLNDQAEERQNRFDQRLSMVLHKYYEEVVALRLERFLNNYKDFDVIFDEDQAGTPSIVRTMQAVTKRVRSVVASAAQGGDIDFVPHRVFVLHTKKPITTLNTFSFSHGDIKAAIEIGEYHATAYLEKFLK